MATLVINNFTGNMTPFLDGDINSGLTNVIEVFGYDPFIQPGNLTWYEDATQIDPNGSVITDMILAGKSRVESGILYHYAIGHTGRLYKIQVNDPNTYNPNYDNPVLLATLSSNSPTFTRGGFIDFFGATERIYIGHDKGVTRIDFDGTNETFVGALGSWTQNVPRPLKQFLGKLYIGNGTNIAEIDSTATVTTYTKLSPGFQTGTQLRDLDVTPDGTYLQSVVAELPLSDITLTTPDTSILFPGNSYIFSWNGTDVGYTSFITYSSVTLSGNHTFGSNQYVLGYDALAGGIFSPVDKFISSSPLSAFGDSPLPNAIFSTSNLMYWSSTLPFDGHLEMLLTMFGTSSRYEIPSGFYAPYSLSATGNETDIIRVPYTQPVSNFAQGASSNGYTDQIFGEPKIYFSTLETSSAPTTKYKLYKFSLFPSGLGDAIVGAIYQTQSQILSKKVKIGEVRIYGHPWVSGNAFTVELIGSGGNVIPGSSKTFTVGTNVTAGNDFVWYSPDCQPTYAIGLRITNEGTVNHTINKVEIDYFEGGK